MAEEKVSIDVGSHALVPRHVKLSAEEAEELLETLKITRKQLPSILKSDPAIRMSEPVEGDVFKILRKSPTSGESVYYRVVVHG